MGGQASLRWRPPGHRRIQTPSVPIHSVQKNTDSTQVLSADPPAGLAMHESVSLAPAMGTSHQAIDALSLLEMQQFDQHGIDVLGFVVRGQMESNAVANR